MPRITSTNLLVIVNLTEAEMLMDAEEDTTVTPHDVHLSYSTPQVSPIGVSFCNTTVELPSALRFYFYGVGIMLVITLGVIGNSLAMVVLTRRTMHTSTNVFLTALAIWDTAVLLVCTLLIGLFEVCQVFREQVFPYVVVYVYPIGLVAQTATVWLTVSFTVERYIAVCHPLRAASMCTIPRARVVVLVLSLVCILYNVPRWLEYRIVRYTDPLSQTCIFPAKTGLGTDSVYHRIYFGWLYFLVMCFIPLCALAVLNACLIVAVRRSQQQRKDMNVRQSRENNVTMMLVSVVMVFIVCQVPALIYNMAYSIDMQRVDGSSSGWIVLSHIRNFLVTLNSAVNFILYCALGQKFRRTFVRTILPCVIRQLPSRFNSFSFNPHRESAAIKSAVNGNNYAKVGYTQCRADLNHSDQTVGIDMKVLRTKHSPVESTDSNASGEAVDIYHSNNSQRSHLRLINPAIVGRNS